MACQLTALPHRAASDLVLCVTVMRVTVMVVTDTWSGATRGACIATRIALPTVLIRPRYDNIYVTSKQ
jgi:hypothetical protein